MGDHSGTPGVVSYFFLEIIFRSFSAFSRELVGWLVGWWVGWLVGARQNFVTLAYDHTTLKAPELVRSPKLSNVGPGEY